MTDDAWEWMMFRKEEEEEVRKEKSYSSKILRKVLNKLFGQKKAGGLEL